MKNDLFEIKDIDKRVYEEELSPFLPEKIIDTHTHVWLKKFKFAEPADQKRAVTWPALVAEESPIEELMETYDLMFPGKTVTPLIFTSVTRADDHESQNRYIEESAKKANVPSLLYAFPEWEADNLLAQIIRGRHLGIKVYLNLAPAYISRKEIRIFDFIPPHQLEVLNKYHMILMLHIPRDGRLGDPVNLAQMMEIEDKYPNIHVIYAHIGRAYCQENFGEAFKVLKQTKRLVFDFSATTNAEAIYETLNCVGSGRLLFGSDLPILRMRMRRICENGAYVNIVPKGMYGDVSYDPNMREVSGEEAENLTFFMYEELRAFKKASERIGLGTQDIEKIFYSNARTIYDEVKARLYSGSKLYNIL